MKLPSNKASGLILSIIILSTGIIVYSNYKEQNPEKGGGVVATQISIDSQVGDTNIDTDGDGLLDWEESLWGTDPLKYDTDGDGTSDQNEISSNRNPLIAGPDDENTNLEDKILSQIKNNKLDEDGITSKVANSFATTYFNARSNGELTAEQKNSLVDQISQKAVEEININPIYKLSSLNTFDSNEEQGKLIKYTDLYLANQVEVLTLIIENYKNKDYPNLGNNIIAKSSNLISMEVPKRIANLHLELSNNYYQLGLIVKGFAREDEDPLYAMLSLRTYQELQNRIEDINSQIGNFLEESGIILGDNGIEIKND